MISGKTPGLIVVYGSYGYTGTLIIDACKKKNLAVILAGRDEEKLHAQHTATGYPYQVVAISEKEKLSALLRPAEVVIHCGGPFQYTAAPMALACLETSTHYTDITGEFTVFELLQEMDAQARQKGIQIMPGTGFDVVPSDCLARHLKQRLPSATNLQLAFAMGKGGGLSRGTARTTIEGLGYGSRLRKSGKIATIPFGSKNLSVDFGPFNAMATCIPWGDIATAWVSTGIPNIEVYMAMPAKRIRLLSMSRYLDWLMRMRWLKKVLRHQIDKQAPGPEESTRERSRAYLWGKVWDDHGNVAISRLETMNGYSLTAETSVMIVEKILAGDFSPGYQTPSTAYGADLILRAANTQRADI